MAQMGGIKVDLGDSCGPAGMRSIEISNGDEAIAALGEPRLAVKKAYITKREPNGEVEVIETSWGPQEAKKGTHYVAKDAGGEYPYDIEAFAKNMEAVPGQNGLFRKATASRLIEVPEGLVVNCITIDQGSQKPMAVSYPGFIGIGVKNEVYPITREVFNSDFEWKK